MDYTYWENALADPAALRNRAFRITTDPQLGFFRTHWKHEPVAIWIADGDDYPTMAVNGNEIPLSDQERVWLSCAKNPVSEEWYRTVADEGGIWPDLDEAVSGIGHNRRAADDPESIIDDLAAAALAYNEVTDDEEAARAISLRAALLEQHKIVDGIREASKAPHLRAAKAVDEEWMHIVKKAKGAADRLRDLVGGWESKKRRLAREAELARAPIDVAPLEQVRSGYGRAASVREKVVVTGIGNLHELVDWLANSRWIDLEERLISLAQKDVDAGLQVRGITTDVQAVVR